MVDCQLCGEALNNENVLECAFYPNIVNTNFHVVASCSCYISQDRGRPHPPSCSPSTRYKTIISASSSQYEQTSYTPHTFHLNPTLE